ncbi:transient receptor potential cation channel subfamily M member 5 [Sarcophilus harrisii]|uniref:transient receptor potential cation channel subfamily M member 5 n=1 Tax=Sarcophilus harrisii TaxID=9305 RepID=UPI001301B034|nr:transient receptor potential cation channel subfamily M member 5 [Sarcophilus harrisii]
MNSEKLLSAEEPRDEELRIVSGRLLCLLQGAAATALGHPGPYTSLSLKSVRWKSGSTRDKLGASSPRQKPPMSEARRTLGLELPWQEPSSLRASACTGQPGLWLLSSWTFHEPCGLLSGLGWGAGAALLSGSLALPPPLSSLLALPHREQAPVAAQGPCPRYPPTAGSKREAGGWRDWRCRQGEIRFVGAGKSHAKFLRVPSALPPGVLFEFMVSEWHLPTPNLVVSLVGEERSFPMKPWLRDVLRKGLVKAMQSTGAWIFTSALRVGLARHVGQAVQDHSLASTSSRARVVTIGIVSLPRVLHAELLDSSQEENPILYKADDGGQDSLYSLDSNHSHLILVDPRLDRAPPAAGTPGLRDPTISFRLVLEKYISEQRTGYGGKGSIEIPVLCLLVNGGPCTLERISQAVENSAPWLILAGSGGVADVMAALVSRPQLIVPPVMEKQLREKFPAESFSREDVLHWTELLQAIAAQQHLLTVHDFERDGSEELDTVILKALVKACKSHSQEAQEYLDELKLAVAWNRIDIAKSEIFSGDVEWKSGDLEEVMMDALVNDKPEFVRLFVDNGASVPDFLTYGRLQELYRAVPQKSLLCHLLLRKHEEGRLTLAGLGSGPPGSPPSFSLHDVARVLKDFLHDACRGFYQDGGTVGRRKSDKVAAKRLAGPKWALDLSQRSSAPWRDLFLWAVLQNRHEMANYFWAMGQEGVAAALAACKILKEMSRLETEAEAARSLREANYEQLALGEAPVLGGGNERGGRGGGPPWASEEPETPVGKLREGEEQFELRSWGAKLPVPAGGGVSVGRPVKAMRSNPPPPLGGRGGGQAQAPSPAPSPPELFSECYNNSEDRAFALLVRRNRDWSRTTCLHLAAEADTKAFFAHDGVQAFLTKIWWGDMATGTPILRLLCAFCCPILIYTNLITFSEEPPLESGLEPFRELDSLDMERTLLFPSPSIRRAEAAEGRRAVSSRFLLSRWKKFWGAPVTVFLGNMIMYFAFLFLFAYVLLVDFRPPPDGPTGPELALYFWVFTLVLEEVRQGFFTDEDTNLLKKFKVYVEDNWNKCDMVAIFLFTVGVSCRTLSSAFEAGRTVLAMDFMVFTLRLIHIFAIHKQLGPKIIVVERMMKDVFFFLFFLTVWLIAYGVTTQALLHPRDSRVEWIFRRVLYRPYLQIFGQIPLDEIDGARVNCSAHPLLLENSPSCPNLYANWLVILLLVTFLLVTNVLLMNLLIAMFSYTFQVVQGNADIFWKSQRYNLIVEYHERPALAPPFILLSHLSLVLKKAFKQEEHKREHLERDLPDNLDQKIVTWETVQKENFLANLEKRRKESTMETLKKTSHRVDFISQHVAGLREQEKRIRALESQVNYCTVILSTMADTLTRASLAGHQPPPKHPSNGGKGGGGQIPLQEEAPSP